MHTFGCPAKYIASLLCIHMPAARRSPWMNDRAQLLVQLLKERYDMVIDEAMAREDISDQVDHVAEGMRIGRQAAKVYITEEWISRFADRIANEVHHRSHPEGGRPQLRIVE